MMRALLCCLLAAPVVTYAQQVSCPLTLPEGSIEAKPPNGWRASTSLVHLGSAGMIRGDPRMIGYLIPNATKESRGVTVDTWMFEKGEEKWLWCGYGMEAIQLAKRMHDAATRCEITAKEKRRGVYADVTIICR